MSRKGIISIIIICLLFALASAIDAGTGISYLWMIPPALILALYALLSVRKFLLLTVFLVPLSVQLRFILSETRADLFLPTELMLAGILVIMGFRTLRGGVDRRLLNHPVTIIILISLAWGIITSLTGAMPVVSLKSIAARLWFFAAFYLLAAEIFSEESNIRKYLRAYIAGMTPVVLYFIIEMLLSGGFNQEAAYRSSWPFFNDHTSFGASLAFCIPVLIFLYFDEGRSFLKKVFLLSLISLFLAAFILSYSRAAWLSLVISVIFTGLLLFRISWKVIIPAAAAGIVALVFLWQPLVMKLGENRQDSSADIQRHLQSISNITTDASNMERINRWKSALRMTQERPVLGWGPATYQFLYAPFQMADEKTVISTIYGEGGNAHSEYLGALSESGIPGMMIYVILLVMVFYTGLKLYHAETGRKFANLLLAAMAGLVSYVIHGALNNFLDTDKISALFWGMTAIIVALDIRRKNIRDSYL